jgi:hypothetical protein
MTALMRFRGLIAFTMLLAFTVRGIGQGAAQPAERDGKLVVHVTWGDMDNTPADNVYVEAHGFVRKYSTTKSFVLTMTHAGEYEASLPPGIYDVFVSEGTSVPRCRRVQVTSGFTGHWTIKLEIDDVYTEKSVGIRP